MAQISLFGQEAQELVKDVKEVPKETKGLKVPKTKEPKKHKATITISYLNYSVDLPENNTKRGDNFISVDFHGHNEDSCGGHDTEKEALAEVENLKKRHGDKYKIEIIDKRFLGQE
jgi:hypothetical protein